MALGFVVSRFGLFIQLLSFQLQPALPATQSNWSAGLGIAFVAVGALTIIIACIQHQRFIATLPQADLPPAYSRAFSLLLSLLVGALGMLLAAYLIVTHL